MKLKRGDKFGDWELVELLGKGANSIVWRTINKKTRQEGALKVPKFLHREGKFIIDTYRLRRFKNEIAIHKKTCKLKIPGILTIIDSCPLESIPEDKEEFNSKDKIPWFVTPVAQQLKEVLEDTSFEKIIETFTLLAETLDKLHQVGIAHRDIKPENLVIFNDIPCLIDFGIAEFPQEIEKDLTKPYRKLGPTFFMAPEMRGRETHKADGKKADVYSFAVTLWAFLTKNWRGFEGIYNPWENPLGLSTYFSENILYEPIEELIKHCTRYSPEDRPTMSEVVTRLKSWKEENKSFLKQKWVSKINRLLPEKLTPRKIVWEGKKDIISILNLISHLNHTLLPTGGGLDMTSVEESPEEGLIDLHFNGFIYRLKPESLTLEYFPQAPEWSFFRLKTFEIDPLDKRFIGKYDEPLTEIERGTYSNYECWEWNNFDGKDLPESSRLIIRILKGSLVFFCKSNPYAQGRISVIFKRESYDSYSALHEKLEEEDFRKFIHRVISGKLEEHQQPPPKHISNFEFIESKKEKVGRLLTTEERTLIIKFLKLVKQAEKEISHEKQKSSREELVISLSGFDLESVLSTSKEYIYWGEKLINFLEKLPSEKVLLIEAVMLLGRDYKIHEHSYTLDEYLKFAKKGKENSINYIISKLGSLGNYLEKGLEKLSKVEEIEKYQQ